MKVASLSALCTGRLYLQDIYLVLISATSWVDLSVTVRLEGLCQRKIPITPLGIEPAAFLIVAQCTNQLRQLYSVGYMAETWTVKGKRIIKFGSLILCNITCYFELTKLRKDVNSLMSDHYTKMKHYKLFDSLSWVSPYRLDYEN